MPKQRTIDEPRTDGAAATVTDDPAVHLPARTDQQQERPQRTALTDLRSGAMSMPVEQIPVALADYAQRRKALRDWLREQMKEGMHYGVPPGCEPKIEVKNGVRCIGVWQKGKNGERGAYAWYPETQWQHKPSLYKAGADFICDLMGIRCEFNADLQAWEQLGSPKGTFVMVCRGFSRQTGELIGEGRGVRRTGQKGGDENNAIKMAQKAAKVDMVLNAYGLSDLFTQDTEDQQPPEVNPERADGAPQVAPRAARATKEQCRGVMERWNQLLGGTRADFERWAREVTCIPLEQVSATGAWTQDHIRAANRDLDLFERDANEGGNES